MRLKSLQTAVYEKLFRRKMIKFKPLKTIKILLKLLKSQSWSYLSFKKKSLLKKALQLLSNTEKVLN